MNTPAMSQQGRMGSSNNASDTTLAVNVDEEDFDLERTIRSVMKKAEQQQLTLRELGVGFEDLTVAGLGGTESYQETMGSLFSPTKIADGIQALRHPPVRNILSGFEGVIRPGEMLLVLGQPGSGCSTLLKTLSNQTSEFHSISGSVNFSSLSPQDLEKHYRGDALYVPEDDVHYPTLSVGRTLLFAAKTRTEARANRVGGKPRDEQERTIVDILSKVFGLRHVLGTKVGNAAIRGVSGGEKKRVSIAEALSSHARLIAWDNSTRGLDSSTALEYVNALRLTTDHFAMTSILSLYQASENIYRRFDKVCVIYEGKMAYFGPADQARQYFIDLGYVPANRQTTADFLVAVTDPHARIPRSLHADSPPPPKTALEFASAFRSSPLGRANREDIDTFKAEYVSSADKKEIYRASTRQGRPSGARKDSPYTLSLPQQLRAVIRRRVQIMQGDLLFIGLNMFTFVFQALIMGSVFLKVPDSTGAYFSRGGILFFALLFAALTAMSEIPALFTQRPIVRRHQRAAMYHPFVEALASTLVDIPITFCITAVFGVVLYFMVQLQQTPEQFFVFLLFVFTTSVCMKAWFRGVAAAFGSEAGATAFAGMSVLIFSIYTGYSIPKPSMIGALRWLSYLNPLRYSFEAALTNEFRTLNGTCAQLVPSGPGYEGVSLANQVCTAVGSVPGQPNVDGRRFTELSYEYSYSNTWMNFGIVVAFTVGFIALLLLFTELRTSASAERSVVEFKRPSSSAASKKSAGTTSNDPEKAHGNNESTETVARHSDSVDAEKAAIQELAPKMTDVFTWDKLRYTVKTGDGEERRLLDDVSGFVAPGRLTALMGESGAGKTTLLNVLSERTSVGVVGGDRFVNGQPLPVDFQSQTGYCQQMDTHLPTATVREALYFSARLRQPASVPLAEKEAYAEKCLKMCGLENHADAIVGSLGVEHRKRTTIGVELAAKPKLLLFLDEPTSGLDSQSAWAIVSFLRTLADSGQAILCTIHQPSAELFQSFDRVLLLRKGGQTVYFGDLGQNASTLIRYFESNGAQPCGPEANPAEWMLDVIGAGATATSAIDWASAWRSSPESKEIQSHIQRIHAEGRNRGAVSAEFHSEFATSWIYQLGELWRRLAQAYWRDPTYIMAKLFLNVAGGLFVGFTFWRAKDSQQGTQNKLFAVFMATILSVPLSNQIQVPWIKNRDVYEIRERPSKMYSWSALVTAQILVEIPWNILGASLLFFCWYWTVGFDSSRAGYTFLMIAFAMPLYYQTFSQAVAAMAPNVEIAALVFSLMFSFVITFNGVLQPFSQLGWWQWMYRLSPYTYVIEGILGQAIGRQDINCSPVELVTLTPPSNQSCGSYMQNYISMAGGYLTNPEASSACQYCSTRTTDEFLGRSFNIFYDHHWRNFGFMMAFFAFNVFLVYSLTYLFRIRRGSLLPKFGKSK